MAGSTTARQQNSHGLHDIHEWVPDSTLPPANVLKDFLRKPNMNTCDAKTRKKKVSLWKYNDNAIIYALISYTSCLMHAEVMIYSSTSVESREKRCLPPQTDYSLFFFRGRDFHLTSCQILLLMGVDVEVLYLLRNKKRNQ